MCRRIYERRGEDPPCGTCLPRLKAENQEALEVYLMVGDQVRVSAMGKVIGLDLGAVCRVMDALGVKKKKECLKKVKWAFQEVSREAG